MMTRAPIGQQVMLLAALAVLPLLTWASDSPITADYTLTLQQRYYPKQGAQHQSRYHGSVAFDAEWYWEDSSRQYSVLVSPLLRVDQRDHERNLVDLQQAVWQYLGEGWDVKAGVDIVFWGVTESQHLVDVINQTDLVASVDGEGKLGQPMLNLNWYGDAGTFNAYLLPYFRERTFAGVDGRLRPPLPVATKDASYQSGQQQQHLDWALRWSRQFDNLDLGLSYFNGTDREPLLQLTDAGRLQPLYIQMQQFAIDAQLISGSWIWKLEAIHRQTDVKDFSAATAGFEFTRVGVFNSNWDLGWIAEYQFDSRDEQSPQPGQNDLFVGNRLALNDEDGTEILLGLVQDLDHSSSRSGKLEASTRLSNSLRLRLDAWFFNSTTLSDTLYSVRDDDFIQLSLDYYF